MINYLKLLTDFIHLFLPISIYLYNTGYTNCVNIHLDFERRTEYETRNYKLYNCNKRRYI